MKALTVKYDGPGFTLVEKDFFEGLAREITRGEKAMGWRQKRQYRIEVAKKAQDYVLRLIDVKADREIDRLTMHATKGLRDLEARLLSDLTLAIERHVTQTALEIQRDFKDAQGVARNIDPEDREFSEEYLKDLRDTALGNLKNIARLKDTE